MLKGERTVLTSIGPDDAEELFQWINDPELVRHNAPFTPVHFADHQAWLESVRSRRDQYVFAIRADGNLIGTCQLFDVHMVHRSAEFQIRIAHGAHRGQGYGTDAARTCLRFARNDAGLHSVWLRVFSTNTGAIRCYQKAGMSRIGTLRQCAYINGTWRDMDVMQVVFDS